MKELKDLCEEKAVKYQDVLDLLELYDFENDGESILTQIATYPEDARKLVTTLLLPYQAFM